ncbi:TPA: aminotransferase class V-fold PLP-dependent enzyme [Escherichia coli]
MIFSVDKVRADFPVLSREVNGLPLAYLDSAASAQKPSQVIDAEAEFYRHGYAAVHRGIHTLSAQATEKMENVRKRASLFINARSAEELVFVRGTTEGINLVANSWGIIGLGAALEYVSALGLNNIAEYEQNLMHYALSQLESVPDLTLYGPQNRLGVIAFNLGKHHAYDVGSFLDNYGIAVRTGHHCAMPLMAYYNVPAMCRASLAMYNTHEEVDRLVTGLQRIHRLLG